MDAGDVRQERGIALRGRLAGEGVVATVGLEGAIEFERERRFEDDGHVVVPDGKRAGGFVTSGPGVEQAAGVGNAPLLRRSTTAGLDPFVLLEVAEDDGGRAGRHARLLGESSCAEPGAWCAQQAVDDLAAAAAKETQDTAGHRTRRGTVDVDVDGLAA